MLVTMSDKEIHRLPVIQAVCEKRLRRRDAASQLGISERQAQRLINRYRISGAEGLVSRKRGQPSNRRLTESLKLGVVCGRGRNPTLRLWPAIFSGEIDVFPSERRNMGQEIGR